jgi:CO/xanthine dehydrogenase FAD-binding subunit
VRAAATVGGNLTLARTRKLESDLAPLLLAAGARVTLASEAGQRCAASAGRQQGRGAGTGRHMRVQRCAAGQVGRVRAGSLL